MTLREQVHYLLEATGWTRISVRDRWVAVYFTLSLTAVGILKEAPMWVWIAVAANFLNAARAVRTIDLPELADGSDEGRGHDEDDTATGGGRRP